MQTKKSKGPRADPQGTPDRLCSVDENAPLKNTCCCRLSRYEINQSKSRPVTPRAWNFLTRMLWSGLTFRIIFSCQAAFCHTMSSICNTMPSICNTMGPVLSCWRCSLARLWPLSGNRSQICNITCITVLCSAYAHLSGGSFTVIMRPVQVNPGARSIREYCISSTLLKLWK